MPPTSSFVSDPISRACPPWRARERSCRGRRISSARCLFVIPSLTKRAVSSRTDASAPPEQGRSESFVFRSEPFAKTRLVSPESLGGSWLLHHPSLRSHTATMILRCELPRPSREAGCPLKRSVSSGDHRMTRAARHGNHRKRRVRSILSQHPIQSHGQLARDHHFGQRRVFARRQPTIVAPQLFVVTRSILRRLHQQRAHHGVALFADRAQPLPSARTVLARNQSQAERLSRSPRISPCCLP